MEKLKAHKKEYFMKPTETGTEYFYPLFIGIVILLLIIMGFLIWLAVDIIQNIIRVG